MPEPKTKPTGYPTDRRASSAKRDTDIMPSDYPLITQAAYQAIARSDARDVNPEILALAMGRIKIFQAMIFVDAAVSRLKNAKGISEKDRKLLSKLRRIREWLEKSGVQYPLTIK